MKQLTSIIQFILGFILGVAILAGGAAGAGYYFLSRMATYPPKPTFTEEKPASTGTETATATGTEETEEETGAESPEVTETPTPTPTPTPQAEEKPEEEEKEDDNLPEGSYQAKVTWKSGLVVRSAPSFNGQRIGGVYYNDSLTILEEQNGWQKIRTASGMEGWVKAGNTRKVN